jgi:hypothetical protein
MQDQLNQKTDIETVKALENSLLERLNEIVKALSKQFADRNDTRKALKLLEKNLKNMYDLFINKGGNENEEDAMFTSKPLGGNSCASCSKNVINMYGRRSDYLPWGKLPFRDPSERIARVGQGFSKMVSMINPDQLSQYNVHHQNQLSQDGVQAAQFQQDHNPLASTTTHKSLLNRNHNMKTQANFNSNLNQNNNEIRPNSAQLSKQRPNVSKTVKNLTLFCFIDSWPLHQVLKEIKLIFFKFKQ